MIKIIEHNNYNKPVDNDTIVEVPSANNQKTKLFKVFDGIWLDPEAVEMLKMQNSDKIKLAPYVENYCKTVEQKSKYLEQMTILFKRINSTPLGQTLLEDLHKGSPIDFSSSEVWNISNMVVPRTSDNNVNRKLRATCIIKPATGYLRNFAKLRSQFGEKMINTAKTTVYFHPDCIFSIKKGNLINYFDPAVALYHELTHVLHCVYGILGATSQEEEYITFGYMDADIYLDETVGSYINKKRILLNNLPLIENRVNSIENEEDRQYFKEKYTFINKSIIDKSFVNQYIIKFQDTHSEYNFAKQLNLHKIGRKSYENKLFLAFYFDISNPKIYSIEKGFLSNSNTIQEIKNDPSNIFTSKNTDILKEILKKCNRARVKRTIYTIVPSVDDYTLIPLEVLNEGTANDGLQEVSSKIQKFTSSKVKKNQYPSSSVAKRTQSIAECQENIADIIDHIRTIEEQTKSVPTKVLNKYSKMKIFDISEDTIFNKPPKELQTTHPIEELETFQAGEILGFARVTPKNMLDAHRINHNLVYGSEPIHFTSDYLHYSITAGNITFTLNKNLSIKMNYMHYGKAVLKTGNAIVNIAQFGMWVDEMIEDFKGDTGKDNLHIANDVLSIVPYLGQVMNIGVDIKDGNYLGAVETLGILVLLEVFPELMLPVFLIGLIVNAIQKNKQQKEMVSKAVWNVLMEREQLLDSQLETKAENLAHICIERIQKIADHVEQQLNFTAQSILTNIKYYSTKFIKTNADIDYLDTIISNATNFLFNAIEDKRTKIIKTLFKSLKKTIFEDYRIKAKAQVTKFNEQTKAMITDMLKSYSNDISTQLLNEALNIIEHHISVQNIEKTIKNELDILSSLLEAGVDIILNKTGVPLAYSHIRLNKENKAADTLSNKVLDKQNFSFAWGRSGNVLKITPGSYLTIDNHMFSEINLSKNFTISFWIKVPLTKNYDKATCKDITIIKNGFNNKNGWAFILRGRYLKFTIYAKNGKEFSIELKKQITTNKWTKITLVNDVTIKKIELYMSDPVSNLLGNAFYNELEASNIDLNLNRLIDINLDKNVNDVQFYIDDFKIYLLNLSASQIYNSYARDYNPELLYDYFGNLLRDNKDYIIAVYDSELKKYLPISKNSQQNYWVYNENIKMKNYKFTANLVLDFTLNITKARDREPHIIYKNDNLYILINDNNNTFKLGINTREKSKEYRINVNNKELLLLGTHIFSLNIKNVSVFKIFNILDYSPSINKNYINSISLGSYVIALNRLLVFDNNELLTIEGILQNKRFFDSRVILPKSNYNTYTNKNDYIYKSIFYLFPADEIEYYLNL